jgi:hypothetical protein
MAHHSHDRAPGQAYLQALANSAGIGPEVPRRLAIDGNDGRAAGTVGGVEYPAFKDRDAKPNEGAALLAVKGLRASLRTPKEKCPINGTVASRYLVKTSFTLTIILAIISLAGFCFGLEAPQARSPDGGRVET